MMVKRMGIVGIGLIGTSMAQDLGVHSTTFPILEQNLLQVIQHQLHHLQDTGMLAQKQREITHRVQNRLSSPLGVLDKKALQKRVYTYDPSYVVSQDIPAGKGQFVARAGDRINPLKTYRLSQNLLFIDGTDEAQVTWALAQKTSKIILTKGQPLSLMKTHQRPIYFDQKGVLIHKLGIQAVPARVTQQKDLLQIEEIPLKEGDE